MNVLKVIIYPTNKNVKCIIYKCNIKYTLKCMYYMYMFLLVFFVTTFSNNKKLCLKYFVLVYPFLKLNFVI